VTKHATGFKRAVQGVPMMMHVRRLLSIFALVAVLAVVMAGCRRQVPPQTPAPPPPPPAAPAAPPPPPPPPPPAPVAAPAPLTEEEIFARKTLAELNAERPLGDVLFDYDQSTLREEARPILQKNAEWIRRWSSTRVTIEGHCDERGSAEYNLALGDRRAAALRDYLVSLGIPATRLVVVSKGKEEQLCREMSEQCWQSNRRGHFVITAK
jgi:peptidoglycan-associated lipoprotein